MLGIERVDKIGRLLVEFDRWAVHEMVLTPDKLKWYWEEFQKMPTLFSDMTRGDIANFVSVFTKPGTFYMEVYDSRHLVGLLYLTDLARVTDCDCHILFFDRKITDKVALCRYVVRWCFDYFKFHRMSATVPSIYHMTARLTKNIGFQLEGTRRQVALVGGKWVDELQYGLLASEMD